MSRETKQFQPSFMIIPGNREWRIRDGSQLKFLQKLYQLASLGHKELLISLLVPLSNMNGKKKGKNMKKQQNKEIYKENLQKEKKR